MIQSTSLRVALGALVLAGSASAQIGATYCSTNLNSTGSIALISATGSTDVTLNDVTLNCDALPLNAFGYFITSQTQGFNANPNMSSGNICIGGDVGRYAGDILNSGSTGGVSLTLDLTDVPHPIVSYAVMPGDTVNFQYWHRDTNAMGLTSNFSEGLEIMFDTVSTGPTFQTDVYPMLTQANVGAGACVSCHGMFGICGLDLSDVTTAYNGLINVAAVCCAPDLYVVPNDPAASVLFQKLGTPACGGPMPQGGTFAGDVNVISDWILAGAPF